MKEEIQLVKNEINKKRRKVNRMRGHIDYSSEENEQDIIELNKLIDKYSLLLKINEQEMV